MTYKIVTPNAGESPGVFPAQNNENFRRLQAIINNDHNFTNSTSSAQGIHKQATFIDRAAPVSLSAGNGILFSSQIDGASQLSWFNGSNTYQITPIVASPKAIVGSLSVPASSHITININPPTANYFATIFVQYATSNSASYYNIMQYSSGTSAEANLIEEYGASTRPTVEASPGQVLIYNNAGATRTILYYLWISKQ